MTVEPAVSAALRRQMHAARPPFGRTRPVASLPLQNYFGAMEATIFSKHGSPRKGSQNGISFNSP